MMVFLVGCVALGGGFVMGGIILVAGAPRIMAAVFFAIPALIGIITLGAVFLRHLAARRMDTPKVEVSGDTFALGETVHYRVTCRAHTPLVVNCLTVSLQMKEVAVRSQGTRSTTYRATIHEETHRHAEQAQLQPAVPVTLEGQLTIPPHLMHTFTAPSNRIFWEMVVAADIPRWPDRTDSYEILVRPERLEATAVARGGGAGGTDG